MTPSDRRTDVFAIAEVAMENWQQLLRVHRRGLGRADLEDCVAQATLELLAATIRGDHSFADRAAIRVALQMRVDSRIIDRCRALAGRSPISAAVHHSIRVDRYAETLTTRAQEPLTIVLGREALMRLMRAAANGLTSDQRLVLRSQLRGEHPAAFCACHGWSLARYRKTGQRARARLRKLTSS